MGLLTLMIGTNYIALGEEANDFEVEMREFNSSNNEKVSIDETSFVLQAPSELKVEEVTGRSISLKWHPVGELDHGITYEVYEAENLLAETDISSYLAEDLVAGKEYTFTVRAKQGAEVSELSDSIRVTTYGEILHNGNLLEMEEDKSGIKFWRVHTNQTESSLEIVNSPVDEHSKVIGINVNSSIQSKTVLLSQEVSVNGQQYYIGAGGASIDSSSNASKVNWKVLFLDMSGNVLMESKLTNTLTGETPAGTASVRVQLVMEEKQDEEPITVYVEPVSFSIEAEIQDNLMVNSQVAEPVTYKYQYDINGRLTVLEMNNDSIQYQYDAKGNLIEKIRATQPTK
ncbi:fibronectin type III domain-containing protein [Paenibacillus xylanexedens]|uniref:fibronectin type III domain-containing protein n=1 Tax=Paenibacillus xylanexedens TaxID=528191 RepID=UPI003CFE83A9